MKVYDYFYVEKHTAPEGPRHICAGNCFLEPCNKHWRLLGLFRNVNQANIEAMRKGYINLKPCSCKSCNRPIQY